MTPLMAAIIGIVLAFVLMFLRMPIALAFSAIGFAGVWYLRGLSAALSTLGTVPYANMTVYIWTVVPLFILMGYLTMETKLAEEFYVGVRKWVGHYRGGLAATVVLGSAGFGAASGDVIGSAVTFTAISLPEMRKFKYADTLTVGTVAAGSNLSMLIPPSLGFILYGAITEVSIGKLFAAGILPGILLALMFLGVIYMECRINPALGPPLPVVSWQERLAGSKGMWALILLFVIIIGGLYIGLFTPTEAAAVGAFFVFVLGLIRKRLDWNGFKKSLLDAGVTTSMVGFLLIGTMIFNVFVVISGLPREIATFIAGLAVPPVVIMGVVLLVYLLLGTFMDALAMVLLTVPIFFPVVTNLGYDPIHFGVLIVIMMTMGHITPPFGIVGFAIHGVAPDVPLFTIFRGAAPFLIAMLICLLLVLFFPQIATFLPRYMMG
jgi:tripartite ATP-independent transporter DctM subunit